MDTASETHSPEPTHQKGSEGAGHRPAQPRPDIARATGEQIRRAIEGARITLKPTTRYEDWGNGRGQGKRIAGNVRGAMADPPRGRKVYLDPFGNLPAQERAEAVLLPVIPERPAYLKARSLGLNHVQGMLAAYAAAGDTTWEHAVALMRRCEAGEPSPETHTDAPGPGAA